MNTAILLSLAIAASPSTGAVRAQSDLIEFRLSQSLNVQTVTCKNFDVLVDSLSNGGHLNGTDCTSTGPIYLVDGNQGAFVFHINLDGIDVVIHGCRVGTVIDAKQGSRYTSYNVNCVQQ